MRMGNKSDPKFSVMPHGWRQLNLGNLCLADGDYGAAVPACSYRYDWPRFIRITDITDRGCLKKDGAVSISPEDSEGYLIGKNDLLFARTGEPGRCYLHDVECNAAFAGYLIRFRADENLALPGYLFQHTQSSSYKKWITDVSQKGAQANINAQMYAKMPIALPPLAEQRKIVEILRTWDKAIATAEDELKTKQGLLRRAVAKYFEKTYRDAASGRIGGLKTLDAVCTRKGEYGAAVSSCPFNPEWPRYIRITDITDTGILKKERAVSISPDSAEGYGLTMGDLLFARTGEPGRCLFFNEAYPAAFAGYLIRFKARSEVILSEYIYYYTLSSVYEKWVGDVSQKGAQANINAKVYGSLQLPVTDLASQEAAVRIFKALQESVLLAEQGAELLRTQKRGLMQKLLTGEVRVAA